MIYITGDTHGDFNRFNHLNLNDEDIMIILGDVGINYYLDDYDRNLKERLSKYNFKFFFIQGNHEERPENISTYYEVEMFGGQVYIEDENPNLIFAKNGELYNFNGKSVLVIGGAYSIDKDYRITKGYPWFENEQLSELERKSILEKYTGKHVDIILSHTCPLKYEPKESFKLSLLQELVDKSMEKFLDKIEEKIDYDKWYCGHYHIEKAIDKLEFMFGRIKNLETGKFIPKYDFRTGYEIVRDACSQNDELICPMCNSKNIVIQKGEGHNIIGLDFIAIICNDCKKIYGYKDVKYKPNCPKEL